MALSLDDVRRVAQLARLRVNDAQAQSLSEAIARRIETELQYPGQIRVTVIRETRASDIAK